jgi:DNA-binding response OmpR family regulator
MTGVGVARDDVAPRLDGSEDDFAGTVLVVEDDIAHRELLSSALGPRVRAHGAGSVSEALTLWRSLQADLMLLDLGLDGGSGLEVLVEVRKTSTAPVIVVTADGRPETSVLALNLGADDVITKPFDIHEVAARIAALLRRTHSPRSAVARYGDLAIDISARRVFVAGSVIHLTPTEFDLLAYLAAGPQQAFTREQLLDAVWSSNPEWQTLATVTEHTRRLRDKLGPAAKHISTVYGRGYRFDP